MLKSPANETKRKICVFFFYYFENAFDSIDREIIWKILNYYGVPDKLVKMIITFYEDNERCVHPEIGDMYFFKIMCGVKQG